MSSMPTQTTADVEQQHRAAMVVQTGDMFNCATQDYIGLIRFAAVHLEHYLGKGTIVDQMSYAFEETMSARDFINDMGRNLSFDENIIALTISIFEKIKQNHAFLFKRTLACMAGYLKEYMVIPKEIDYMKIAFWYGVVLDDLLSAHERDVIRMARLLFLDLILRCNTSRPVHPVPPDIDKPITHTFGIFGHGLDVIMLNKLYSSVLQDRNIENYGRYGEYSIFKNCSRMCSNTCCVTNLPDQIQIKIV